MMTWRRWRSRKRRGRRRRQIRWRRTGRGRNRARRRKAVQIVIRIEYVFVDRYRENRKIRGSHSCGLGTDYTPLASICCSLFSTSSHSTRLYSLLSTRLYLLLSTRFDPFLSRIIFSPTHSKLVISFILLILVIAYFQSQCYSSFLFYAEFNSYPDHSILFYIRKPQLPS